MPLQRERVGAEVQGGEELIAALKELGLSVKGSVRKACRQGSKVMRDAAEANARSVSPGTSGKHAVIKSRGNKVTQVEFYIQPSKKKWYFKFFETGAVPHEIPGPLAFEGDAGSVLVSSAQHPGMAARPWLRPAFDNNRDAAAARVGEVLKEIIETRRAQLDSERDDDD